MNARKLIAGALGAALLLGALPGMALAQDDTTEVTPEGVDWVLSTLAGDAVPEGIEVTLVLSGGEAVGSAGCNSYFGAYELDGDALTFPDPFGLTRRLCEDPVMAVEDAYLPLLQETASWSIDDAGALSLADADGTVGLVYGEAPIDVTGSDVDALVAALGDLQAQIDEASTQVAALAEEAASIDVNRFDKRLTATEESVAGLEKKVDGVNSNNLKKRIAANEEAIAELEGKVADINLTINKLRDRIRTLEAASEDHEARISALEEAGANPPA
jgi:heat shock protein HslJ